MKARTHASVSESVGFKLHYASVLEREAAARAGSSFAALLLAGAARARSEAAAPVGQGDLFA